MSNQNQFEITQKIHQELDKLTKTTGIKVESDFPVVESDNTLIFHYKRMTYFQIKQILIAFEEKLGENPKTTFTATGIYEKLKTEMEILANQDKPKSKSEALCQKWLDGLEPLFDSNPTQVLTELLEILQNIK